MSKSYFRHPYGGVPSVPDASNFRPIDTFPRTKLCKLIRIKPIALERSERQNLGHGGANLRSPCRTDELATGAYCLRLVGWSPLLYEFCPCLLRAKQHKFVSANSRNGFSDTVGFCKGPVIGGVVAKVWNYRRQIAIPRDPTLDNRLGARPNSDLPTKFADKHPPYFQWRFRR
ncbi:MAG TPA: hypothetical protein VFH27_15135 [Longimicrobiaceae bacterium]|nr:hypothetical protein [Longimicrobiaceae bacterium]